jgi:S1-C subfamily serine protease
MRSPWLIISLALVGVLAVATACGGGDNTTTATPKASASASPTPAPTVEGVSDLAHAVVEIIAVDSGGNPVWWGSGTLISADGLILTNGHVIDNRKNEYKTLQIALTVVQDEPPDVKYTAEIQTVDYAIDLAVIKITKTIGGNAVHDTFPFVKVGDSDNVNIGDSLQILGYPGIGGETITYTRGAVSGFTSEHSVGNRAWIKTDATIAGGNSGGLAINDQGKLIGVPSITGSGSQGQTVDCRPLADTNGDHVVDSNDTCVPVGGFINGLRPVNLAQNLIADAESGTAYVSPYQQDNGAQATPVGGTFDTSNISFKNITFSSDVTSNDQPVDTVIAFPSAPQNVCAFWDYSGMQDGMSWEADWYIDGTLDQQGSIVGSTWAGGGSGNWWVCVTDQKGLPDGTYEVVLQVEGNPQAASALYVGDDHKVVDFEIDNQGSAEICAAAISPVKAQNWGGDKLGSGVTVPSGSTRTLKLATGDYDILMVDCSGTTILQDTGVSITKSGTYTVTDQ